MINAFLQLTRSFSVRYPITTINVVRMGIDVELNAMEVGQAAAVGVTRHIKALVKGLKHKHLNSEEIESWQVHIEGACAECAFAKGMDIHWHAPVDTFKTGYDVGGFQIRSSEHLDGCLIVRPDDTDDEATFYLVTGSAPYYTIRGWIVAREAKRLGWWGTKNNRPCCWWVNQSDLTDAEIPYSKHSIFL